MKKAIFIISIITLFFVGCKKDDIAEASKLRIETETIEKGWDYVKINVEYDYPVELEAVTLYLSEKEDMSGAEAYECKVEGNKFSVEVEGLKEGTACYYCYEYDNGYEKVRSEAGGLMVITTKDITNVGLTKATCGGDIIYCGDDKITSRGVCWSTSQNPTINDNKTTEGSGIGSYSSYLSNLSDNTTYYIRAYATNEKGTSYGEEKSFTTLVFKNETFAINGVTFTMIAVEGGTFQMGATSEQGSDAESDESPVHSITLSDYYIGETEVTQELWEAVMGSNPSSFSGSQKPVEYVSWNDCQEFITKLNELTGKNFRLPTEAEWEYAARGGNKSKGYKYSGSNTIGNVAWYNDNSVYETHEVKTKQANELGIYDMSGNVWEWCHDWYGSYSSGSQTNPTGPTSGSYRVYRGGSWDYPARFCRVSLRGDYGPDYGDDLVGLRLSLS